MNSAGRAVVIVSGGAAISPFTTPDASCRTGLPAGNTDTFLREGLLAAGHEVFTSPATTGEGTATADIGWQGFADPAEVLPPEVTVNSVGQIDAAGAALARFLRLLWQRYGYTSFDLVGHSMGGLFSRAATRELRTDAPHLTVGSITTLGTPWSGSFVADARLGDLPAEALAHPAVQAVVAGFTDEADLFQAGGAADQVTRRYLSGADGWNARQAGVLDGIPVTVIGGAAFTDPAAGTDAHALWPNDGLVALASALAVGLPPAVLPERVEHQFPDAHSIFFADQFGLPWERALTWDPAVLDVVLGALAGARGA